MNELTYYFLPNCGLF